MVFPNKKLKICSICLTLFYHPKQVVELIIEAVKEHFKRAFTRAVTDFAELLTNYTFDCFKEGRG